MEGCRRLGAWPQEGRKFLKKGLYLLGKPGDGGGRVSVPWLYKRRGTCLGEGAARGRVQNLLFIGDNTEAKFYQEIHAEKRRRHGGEKKVKLKVGTGKNN